MTTPWYLQPVTQGYNPPQEYGVDLGTPFHSLLTAILGGTVRGVNCSVPYRCEVDIAAELNGQTVTESYLHVDIPEVAVGQQLAPGATIGLSGGEITSLPGAQNIDSPSVSTGPHVEFDLFRGGPFQNPLDPTAVARGGPQGASDATQLGTGPLGLPTPGDLASAISAGLSGAAGSIGAGVGQGLSAVAGTVGAGIVNAGSGLWANVQTLLARNLVAFVVAAVVITVLFL